MHETFTLGVEGSGRVSNIILKREKGQKKYVRGGGNKNVSYSISCRVGLWFPSHKTKIHLYVEN